MGKYANFYDGVRKLLDKIADALDPGAADTKTANYQTAVLNSLSRIGDKVGDVVSATLPDASTATDGDTLVVADGEWTIGSGGGGGTGGESVLVANMSFADGSLILDKTYGEIKNANYALVKTVSDGSQISYGFITGIIDDENGGDVYVASPSLSGDSYTLMSVSFHANTENDYPSASI